MFFRIPQTEADHPLHEHNESTSEKTNFNHHRSSFNYGKKSFIFYKVLVLNNWYGALCPILQGSLRPATVQKINFIFENSPYSFNLNNSQNS
jgi:hypothetical protein